MKKKGGLVPPDVPKSSYGTMSDEFELEVVIPPDAEGLELTSKNVVKMIEYGLNALWFSGEMKIDVLEVRVDTRIGGKTVVVFQEKQELAE